MQWRRTESGDIAAIRKIWEEAEYGFDFPDLADAHFLSSWIALEHGRIVAWAGARTQVEVIAVMDRTWGSPHTRTKLFATLHKPLAEDVHTAGYDRVFANVDPRYPRFGKCLARFGWWKGWETWWVTIKHALDSSR